MASKVTFPWVKKKDAFRAYKKASDITEAEEIDQLDDGKLAALHDFRLQADLKPPHSSLASGTAHCPTSCWLLVHGKRSGRDSHRR